jgi:actin-related protein 10
MPPKPATPSEVNAVVIELTEDVIRAGFPGNLKPVAEKHISPYWAKDIKSLKNRTSLLKAFTSLFYDKLLVSPRTHKVIVVEESLWSVEVKRTVAHLLLSELHVAGLIFLPSAVCCAVGSQRRDALVVSIGWFETTVVPVYDLRELQSTSGVTTGIVEDERRSEETDPESYGATRGLQLSDSSIPGKSKTLSEGELEQLKLSVYETTSTNLLSSRLERLIEDHDHPDDNERSIPLLINTVLSRLDLTCRQSCQLSIIITGPFGSIPHLSNKILERVQKKWSNARLVATSGAWAGASVHSSFINWPTSGRVKGELTLDRYLSSEGKLLFEWLFEGS